MNTADHAQFVRKFDQTGITLQGFVAAMRAIIF
jgi:hypothetical protein